MALRWPLESYFELFWALVAKWLSDGPWRLSFSCCDSIGAESIVKYRVRYSRGAESVGPLERHFELFWAVVAKWLSDGLWRVILSSSGLCWPNGSQMASGDSF